MHGAAACIHGTDRSRRRRDDGADRIRIKGIDTPEVSESGGFEASQRLDLLLREGPVMVIPQALDVYGRVVADVYVNNQNVADTLTQEGYAKPR